MAFALHEIVRLVRVNARTLRVGVHFRDGMRFEEKVEAARGREPQFATEDVVAKLMKPASRATAAPGRSLVRLPVLTV